MGEFGFQNGGGGGSVPDFTTVNTPGSSYTIPETGNSHNLTVVAATGITLPSSSTGKLIIIANRTGGNLTVTVKDTINEVFSPSSSYYSTSTTSVIPDGIIVQIECLGTNRWTVYSVADPSIVNVAGTQSITGPKSFTQPVKTNTIQDNGGGAVIINVGGTNEWEVNSGTFSPIADNAKDIGATGAKPRDLNLGRDANIGRNLNVSGYSDLIGVAINPAGINGTIVLDGTQSYVTVDSSGGAISITLPDVFSTNIMGGHMMLIKDAKGASATHNITISTVAGQTIDGGSSIVINTNYGSVMLFWDGVSNWESQHLVDVTALHTSGNETASGVKNFSSGIKINSQPINSWATKSASFTAAVADGDYYSIDTTSAAVTATLFDGNLVQAGYIIRFKDRKGTAATHNITVIPFSGQTIDNGSSLTISSNNAAKSIKWDGVSNWEVF